MKILVRYVGNWGLGDLLCSDPMIAGLVEQHGAEIWVEGNAGNVIHNPLVRGVAPNGFVADRVVEVRLFTHMDLAEYGHLEAMPSLIDHMCSYAGVTPRDRRPKLHLGDGERRFLEALPLAKLPRPLIAICADHVDPLRHWPVARWREVARRLHDAGASVLGIGTKDTLGVGADFVGKLTMRQTAALLTRCDLFLGNNSGPFHYAQAAGCASVVLFSLATPERFVHPGAKVFAVQASELPCIDCMTRRFAAMQQLGCIASPRGRCVTDVDVEGLMRQVARALGGASNPREVLVPLVAQSPMTSWSPELNAIPAHPPSGSRTNACV